MDKAAAVIFDLDDTLCDYRGAKQRALYEVKRMLASRGIDHDEFVAVYETEEPELFRRFVSGELDKSEYRMRRFSNPLSRCGWDGEPGLAAVLNARYMSIANEEIRLFDDVIGSLADLRQMGFELAVLTNGPSDGQRQKIGALGLECHIDQVCISEEMGLAKPDPACFRAVAIMLGRQSQTCLMVGDSIAYDVEGARAAGMRSILIDRHNEHPNYSGERVRGLRELICQLDRERRMALS